MVLARSVSESQKAIGLSFSRPALPPALLGLFRRVAASPGTDPSPARPFRRVSLLHPEGDTGHCTVTPGPPSTPPLRRRRSAGVEWVLTLCAILAELVAVLFGFPAHMSNSLRDERRRDHRGADKAAPSER